MTDILQDSNINFAFKANQALPMLIEYREAVWKSHCTYVLNNLLIPYFEKNKFSVVNQCNQVCVLIENRINSQWLFTLLNTIIMSPANTGICLIMDKENQEKARSLLTQNNLFLDLIWISTDQINSSINLKETSSFNKLMKSYRLWDKLPHERILIIQTDALLSEPLPKYFFNFEYLGAPFLPKKYSEYFENLSNNGEIINFFKVDTPIHGSPNKDVYPHLYGNGGLSIRNKSLMKEICCKYSLSSSTDEQEDVFFSRHLKEFCNPVPIQIAKAFAFETSYEKSSIGCHAPWKYLTSSELGEYLDKHLRKVWSILIQ